MDEDFLDDENFEKSGKGKKGKKMAERSSLL